MVDSNTFTVKLKILQLAKMRVAVVVRQSAPTTSRQLTHSATEGDTVGHMTFDRKCLFCAVTTNRPPVGSDITVFCVYTECKMVAKLFIVFQLLAAALAKGNDLGKCRESSRCAT